MKAQTLLVNHDGTKKMGEGDLAVTIQGNQTGERLLVNLDWSFPNGTPTDTIKSLFGGLLGNLEDIYGEKMVTEIIHHWAQETGKIVDLPGGGKAINLKSKDLEFKK